MASSKLKQLRANPLSVLASAKRDRMQSVEDQLEDEEYYTATDDDELRGPTEEQDRTHHSYDRRVDGADAFNESENESENENQNDGSRAPAGGHGPDGSVNQPALTARAITSTPTPAAAGAGNGGGQGSSSKRKLRSPPTSPSVACLAILSSKRIRKSSAAEDKGKGREIEREMEREMEMDRRNTTKSRSNSLDAEDVVHSDGELENHRKDVGPKGGKAKVKFEDEGQ